MGSRETNELDISDIIEEVGSEVALKLPEHFDEAPTPLPRTLLQLDRYNVIHRLGRGGMGQVVAADDIWLNRQVAIKLVHGGMQAAQRVLHRFTREAQVTAQLEHPNIVPVYDMGVDDRNQLFFVMRRVSGVSVAEIIDGLAKGDPLFLARFSRNRLLGIFQKVCMAVAYAHSRRVIHRDLKPANVMVGEHGEVYVMDWGLCRVVGSRVDEETARINLPDPLLESTQSSAEGLQGTPIYMAPEELGTTSHRGSIASDVYALGAILYELLTYQPILEGGTLAELISRAIVGEIVPPRLRAPDREIPPALDAICLKALNRDAELRFESAHELHDSIEQFLEGTEESERRTQAARRAVEAGMSESTRFEETLQKCRDAELELYLARLRTGTGQTTGYDLLYRLSKRLERLEEESVDSLSEAARRFEEALTHDPDNVEARAHLARLFWSRFISAESRGDRNDARYFRRLVETFNDGQFDSPLSGEGVLRLATEPAGAFAVIQEFVENQGVFSLSPERELGETPLEISPIAMGSYLLTLTLPGYQTTKLPILVERQARPHITLKLRTEAEVGTGFIHVPGGPFVVGGDQLNPPAGPRRVEIVTDFAIAIYPVTAAQYLEFINELARMSPGAARARAPRLSNGEILWTQGNDGTFSLPEVEDETGLSWYPTCPVTRINWHDAMAYCSWLSRRTGLPLRLPTSAEWEKASRGVDGRVYPWGSRFDPSYCKMCETRASTSHPEPVGTFPMDQSPYGALDMAGSVAEWCGGWFDADKSQQPLRGLGFEATDFECRLTYVRGHRPSRVLNYAGFRLAHGFDWEET